MSEMSLSIQTQSNFTNLTEEERLKKSIVSKIFNKSLQIECA